MEENGTITVNRAELQSMAILLRSMSPLLKGCESRLQKEVEMVQAVMALMDRTHDALISLVGQHP